MLSTINICVPLTSVDFHPNGSLVAVGTMGQNASVFDLRDPKKKLAHLINEDHGNVYSVRFETKQINIQRPTTLLQETNKGMSTFAQQTTRSRHTSSSSTPQDGPTTNTRLFDTQPRTEKSRERSISSTTNKFNTPTLNSTNSTITDGSMISYLAIINS